MTKLTPLQAAIISAYTGIMVGEFSELHKYAERIMERPVFTHEFGDETFAKQLKERSKEDFLSIQPNEQ